MHNPPTFAASTRPVTSPAHLATTIRAVTTGCGAACTALGVLLAVAVPLLNHSLHDPGTPFTGVPLLLGMIAPAGLALAGIILMASRRSATGDPRRRGMIFALLYGITINAGSTALGFSFWNLDALSLWAHHPGQHQSHSIIAVIIYTVAPLCAAVHVTACLFSARLLLFPRKKKLRPRNSCLT